MWHNIHCILKPVVRPANTVNTSIIHMIIRVISWQTIALNQKNFQNLICASNDLLVHQRFYQYEMQRTPDWKLTSFLFVPSLTSVSFTASATSSTQRPRSVLNCCALQNKYPPVPTSTTSESNWQRDLIPRTRRSFSEFKRSRKGNVLYHCLSIKAFTP